MGAQIPDMPATHGERVEFMNFLGQAAAKSGRVDQLQQVFLVTEGWMSEPSEDVPTRIRPSEDPHRKEVLIISAIQISKHKRQMEVFEVTRDANEQVIGLEKFLPAEKKEDESVEVPSWMHLFRDFKPVSKQNTTSILHNNSYGLPNISINKSY